MDGRDQGGRNIYFCEGDTLTGCLTHVPQPEPGIEPTTEVHALNQELNLWHFCLQTNALTNVPNWLGKCLDIFEAIMEIWTLTRY